MFEVDNYLAKRFDLKTYNCWHFVRDVWLELTGQDLRDWSPTEPTRDNLQAAFRDGALTFTKVMQLHTPDGRLVSLVRENISYIMQPLIVLMSNPSQVSHVGVLFEGRVLQLRQQGVMYQYFDAATAGFSHVEFYTTP